jgi:proline iminopeptidase
MSTQIKSNGRRAVETGWLEVPGGRVWWKKAGDSDALPLLLLHGGPGASHNYLLPIEALADERPVIFYDQLGCGLSDAPAQPEHYRIERFVEEVDCVRDALGLDRIALYGHSWGSILAIEYLVTGHGSGVEKLILAGAIPSVPMFVAGMERLLHALPDRVGERILALQEKGETDTSEFQDLLNRFFARHVIRTPPTPEFERSVASLTASPAYAIMNGPNEITVTGTIREWDRRANLGVIGVPTMLTTGEYDEVTIDCHEAVRDAIPGAALYVLPDCSHLTMLESPDGYNALLRSFLA